MLKLPLSDRLLACCRFVRPGDRVADVGCDHGYLGIHLLLSGTASSVLAGDVRVKPLEKARINGAKYGVQDKMQFFLSDGVQKMPHDFDTMVCAGMGGDTMVSILYHAPWLRDPHYRLILQCQTKNHILRRYLSENGWEIQEEEALRDGHFLYTIMVVAYTGNCDTLTPGQYFLPPALLAHKSREVSEHYARMLKMIRMSVLNRGEDADPVMKQAMTELENLAENPDFQWLKEVTL